MVNGKKKISRWGGATTGRLVDGLEGRKWGKERGWAIRKKERGNRGRVGRRIQGK